MLTVSISGSNMNEIREKAASMLNLVFPVKAESVPTAQPETPVDPVVPTTPPTPAAQAQEGEPVTGKRKPGRPKKEVAKPEAPVAPAPPAAPVSTDDAAMRTALQSVDKDGGYENAVAILKQFGYRKVKEVKPEHFAAIIAECGKRTA